MSKGRASNIDMWLPLGADAFLMPVAELSVWTTLEIGCGHQRSGKMSRKQNGGGYGQTERRREGAEAEGSHVIRPGLSGTEPCAVCLRPIVGPLALLF